MCAFVRTHRNRAGTSEQRRVLAGGKRLFDQDHTKPGRRAQDAGEGVRREAFIGVQDQARLRAGKVNGLEAGEVIRSAELQLEQHSRHRLCGFGHGVRRVEADGHGGLDRFRLGQAGELPDGLAAPFRFQVPEGAVEGAARRAGGQCGLERGAVHPRLDLAAHAFEGGRHTLDCFAEAAVGNAFAPSRVVAFREAHAHGLRLRLGAARDRESRPQGRGNGGNFELPIAHRLILPGELCWTGQPCA